MIAHILFVDDDVENYEIFEETVKEINFAAKITNLKDGLSIEKYLKPPPDIIFLDYNIPIVNGRDCLKKIRSSKEYENVPIVIYSVYFDKIPEAKKNGTNYFIVKQVKLEKLEQHQYRTKQKLDG
jgi:CheY-like chemotaxis protein